MLHNDFGLQLYLTPSPCMCWIGTKGGRIPAWLVLTGSWTRTTLSLLITYTLHHLQFRSTDKLIYNSPCRNPTKSQEVPECLEVHWIKWLLEVNMACKHSGRRSVGAQSSFPGVVCDCSGLFNWLQFRIRHVGKELVWHTEQCNTAAVVAILAVPFLFPDRDDYLERNT